jgi:hypothetical protein
VLFEFDVAGSFLVQDLLHTRSYHVMALYTDLSHLGPVYTLLQTALALPKKQHMINSLFRARV